MIDAGYLVEFIDKSQITLAVVQSTKKGRLSLLSWQDKQIALPEGRVLAYSASRLNPQAPRNKLVEALAEIEARRQTFSKQVDVAELWELVHSEGSSFSLQQLAELAFSDPVGADHIAATLRAIFDDRTYFRLNNQGVEPLSAEQLEQKKIQQQREAQKKAQQQEFQHWLKQNMASHQPQPIPPELEEMLLGWVLEDDNYAGLRQLKPLLAEVDVNSRRQVFELLQRLGRLDPHHNLSALREQIAWEFTPETLDVASRVEVTKESYPWLELDIFTIDGEETRDFDDALSFVPSPDGGGQLGIHITSLEAITSGSLLDEEARARATTLYLPENPIPMLPRNLSEGVFSLRQGEERPVVSCLVDLSPAGEVLDYKLATHLIRVKERLSYQQVDERLANNDAFLGKLQGLTQKLHQQRDQSGACFLPLPELDIKINDQWEVTVKVLDRDGPAREMVAETAILANRLKGEFMASVNIPSLYRVQPMPKQPWENSGPEALFANFSKRRQLQRVELSLEPGLHAGLGVQSYVHATSPIRRYLDMLVQRQLLAHLHGKTPPLDGPGLLEVAQQADVNLRAANRVRLARQRYWQLKWLQQNQGKIVPALVLEQQMRTWQLLLLPIMFIANIPRGSIKLAAGQEVQVKILRAEPFEDIVRLELA